MAECGDLRTCSQSISFCKPRELICFSKCGKINQTCGTAVTYFTNTTSISLNGFLTINNEDLPTTGCNMSVAVTDATGAHTVTVLGGETVTIGVAGLSKVVVTCTGTGPALCTGEWAVEGSYEARPFAY